MFVSTNSAKSNSVENKHISGSGSCSISGSGSCSDSLVSQKGTPNQEDTGGAGEAYGGDDGGDAGGDDGGNAGGDAGADDGGDAGADAGAGCGTGGQIGQSVLCSADTGVELDELNVIEMIAIIRTDIKIDGNELLLLFLTPCLDWNCSSLLNSISYGSLSSNIIFMCWFGAQ